ncbi:MAG: hypothetical protein BWY52_02686 [Chloroflexi bacterium ADurb.Bin325]|nr:MAG: hypothetical protein BWY52_02686 [Chloroflexi bacterium ADurb.Bin325]
MSYFTAQFGAYPSMKLIPLSDCRKPGLSHVSPTTVPSPFCVFATEYIQPCTPFAPNCVQLTPPFVVR